MSALDHPENNRPYPPPEDPELAARLTQILADYHRERRGKPLRMRNAYPIVKCPGHPAGGKEGMVYEHRLVVEARLGRYLTEAEEVHHRNEIRHDNRDDNLIWCRNEAEHQELHGRRPRLQVECACGCGSIITSPAVHRHEVRFVRHHHRRRPKEPAQTAEKFA